jgi:hypothetical protein
VFRGWFRMLERCSVCGWRLQRQVGFALGVMTINIAMTSALFVVFLVAGFVATVPDPPIGLLWIGGAALCAIVPVAFYPSAGGIWAAIELIMRPPEPAEEADALTWLAVRGDRATEADPDGGPGG